MAEGGFEREIEVARQAARRAGEVIVRHAREAPAEGPEHEQKGCDSPVTRADLEADEAILDTLTRAFPRDSILSEETRQDPAREDAERVWIVDPLDGTKEFIARIPEYAVSIALCLRGQPVVGVVLQPQTGECFWAVQGGGAWLEERRLRVSTRPDLAASLLLSSRTEMSRGQIDPFRDWFREVRPVGSVALKLALTAASSGDLWVSMAPKSEWDVCAGDLLVREAGGVFVTGGAPGGDRASDGDAARRYNQSDVLLQPEMAAGPRALVSEFRRRRERCA